MHMPEVDPPMGTQSILSLDGLRALIEALARLGYQVLGPTVRDGAIVYDEVAKLADLPAEWTDQQDAGRYRLERRSDDALFGYAVGPQSWRRFLQQPMQQMWQAQRTADGFAVVPAEDTAPRFAFLGVRACEIHAIAIQDKVLVQGPYVDTDYQRRRRDNFIVAVNCGEAGGTCFCVSMNTGPKVDAGYDLALTELLDGDEHRFLIETGSAAGARLLSELPHEPAATEDVAAAAAVVARTAGSMGRKLDTDGLKQLL
jgi:sulfhydrogenase subunit beta (sulfur reductase)